MSGSFDVYQLPEEHRLLREVVRDLADTVIAPRAAEIDETAEFPHDVYKALVGAELHAPHIPEAYGGVGADAIAAAIVVEEIARACVSSSLIPAVNKLGTQGILLSGSEELKARYLPEVASGEAMFSYALTEPEAGSDAAAMTTRGGAQRRRLGPQRHEALDHQCRRLHLLHGHGVDRPVREGQGHLRVRGPRRRPPASRTGRSRRRWASRARRPASSTSTTSSCPPTG